LDKKTIDNLKLEIRPLLLRLKKERGMTIEAIAMALNMNKSKGAVAKWRQGKHFPPNSEVATVVAKLKHLLTAPDHLLTLKGPRTEDEDNSYGNPPESFLVWIPLDLDLPFVDYNGIKRPIALIQMGEKKGVVTYRSTSKFDAEGEIFAGQTGMASDIEPSTRIAIKRINKTDWKTDRYYVIIDASEEISICELLPGDNESTVRLVSTKTPDGPHRIFPFERILAIFSIVDGHCIPTPKRNSAAASIAQQPNLSAVNSLAP
jgi:transcriptional regulator with XRE-family HTH domain